jgi:hypothetical protein
MYGNLPPYAQLLSRLATDGHFPSCLRTIGDPEIATHLMNGVHWQVVARCAQCRGRKVYDLLLPSA